MYKMRIRKKKTKTMAKQDLDISWRQTGKTMMRHYFFLMKILEAEGFNKKEICKILNYED